MRRLNAHGLWDIRDSDNEDARILYLVHSIEHNETIFGVVANVISLYAHGPVSKAFRNYQD